MAPIHLTKNKVETLLAGLTPSCRHEMELSLDTQLELSEECKSEVQNMLSDVPGVNPMEGTSKRMKMNSPPSSESTPPEMYGGEAPVALNTFFDVTVVLTSIVAFILTAWYLFGLGKRSSSGDGSKKGPSELSTRKLIVKAAAQRRK